MCTTTPVTVFYNLQTVFSRSTPRSESQIFTVTRLYRIARRLASGLAPRRASALRTRRSGATGRYLCGTALLPRLRAHASCSCVMLRSSWGSPRKILRGGSTEIRGRSRVAQSRYALLRAPAYAGRQRGRHMYKVETAVYRALDRYTSDRPGPQAQLTSP